MTALATSHDSYNNLLQEIHVVVVYLGVNIGTPHREDINGPKRPEVTLIAMQFTGSIGTDI